MKEIWKDIKGYEGLYQISNLGNVKKIKNKNGEVIKVWNSTMDIERELGIIHNNITFCCKHYNRTAGGFIWEYYKELGGK